ncbi:MAG TPA: hypothetical protein VGZ03_07390 [Acidimicrobiales bacterium]|nr:hypothetical protein [Acidimicrobiales bacterium]
MNALGPSNLSAIACPTSLVCTAVGGGNAQSQLGAIFRTSNGGVTWVPEPVAPSTPRLSLLSCPTVSYCMAVGLDAYWPVFAVTTDGGARWTSENQGDPFADPYNFRSLDCTSSKLCYATAGGNLLRSTDDGARWADLPMPASDAVACPRANTCFGVSTVSTGPTYHVVIDKSTNFGHTFKQVLSIPTSGSSPAFISCPTPGWCMTTVAGVTGARVTVSSDGGRRWTTRSLPASVGVVGGLSCGSPTTCAIPSPRSSPQPLVAATTTDAGATWAVARITSSSGTGGGGVSCPHAATCFVDGFGSPPDVVFVGHPSAATWSPRGVPSGRSGLLGVACATASICLSVGIDYVEVSRDSGATWQRHAAPPDTELNGVACPSGADCLAVGRTDQGAPVIFRTADAGSHWSPATLPPGVSYLFNVACATTMNCVAMGGTDILRTTDGGASWTRASIKGLIAGGYGFGPVSCGSPTDCVAVDSGADAVTSDAGATWTVVTASASLELADVSCASATTCLASGYGGQGAPFTTPYTMYRTTDGGLSWKAIGVFDDVTSLACAGNACKIMSSSSAGTDPPIVSIETSVNIGTTWTSMEPPLNPVLTAATMLPSGRWIFVGVGSLNGPFAATER